MHDLFAQVLSQSSSWKDIFTNDAVQDRYNKAIDSLRLLCRRIEPGQWRFLGVIPDHHHHHHHYSPCTISA